MNTGGNAIIVLSSIVVGKLLDSIGIIKVFYILSAMCALLCFICLVFKQQLPRRKKITLKQRFKDSLGLDIFQKKRYIIWVISTFIGIYGNTTPLITMVKTILLLNI